MSSYTNSTVSTRYEQSMPITLIPEKMQNLFLQEQKGSHDAQARLELFTAEGDREPLGLLPATSLVPGLGACSTGLCHWK